MHGLDDNVMIGNILRKLTALKNIDEATSNQILIWAWSVEAQRAQKEFLHHIREDKAFDSIRHIKQNCDNVRHSKNKVIENFKYCGTRHLQRQCQAYGKMCGS